MSFLNLHFILVLLGIVAPDPIIRPAGQIRVAVIDSGLDLSDPRFKNALCPTGHRNFVGFEKMNDTQGHGTCMADLIQKNAGKSNYCLLIYKYFSPSSPGGENLIREIFAIEEAIRNKANIINISAGGPISNQEESDLIQKHPEITFVVAAGNNSQNIDIDGNKYYPASYFYPNIKVVGSVDKDGKTSSFSNYGSKITNREIGRDVRCLAPNNMEQQGNGTSQATAIFSGKLVDKRSKIDNNGVNDVHKF